MFHLFALLRSEHGIDIHATATAARSNHIELWIETVKAKLRRRKAAVCALPN
jgi:hypothetical protein